MTQASKQGRPIPGVEIKIIDENGNDSPWNGKDVGNLLVRGPWVCRSYYDEDDGASCDGYSIQGISQVRYQWLCAQQIGKRRYKVGGEWISSIELENIANSHPNVDQCAVIGVHHPKWEERPILLVVQNKSSKANLESELLDWFQNKVAKCGFDKVIFIDELPLTVTEKVSKLALREKYSKVMNVIFLESFWFK